ncbi:MAG: hypothetical protein AABY53_09565 [Bdellovibrionota bacterium]
MNKENVTEKFIFILSALVSFTFVSLLLFGCASSPSKSFQPQSESDAILIQTKAQIKNNDETNTVKIEIALLPKKAIRLEITATLGVSVASVLMRPTAISYALHSTKQFATGPFNEKTLYPVFKKNIDPRILWRIINNQPMGNLNLKCDADNELKPIKCVSDDGTTIKWTYEAPFHKKIEIISNRFEMRWVFRDQSLLSESQNKTFVLNKPENYQEIIIK